jgi:hypothetical protein
MLYSDIEARVLKNINSTTADVSVAVDNAIDFLGNFYDNHKIDSSLATVANQSHIDKPALCKEVVRVAIAGVEYEKIQPKAISETQEYELNKFIDYNDKIQIFPTPSSILTTEIYFKSFFTPLAGVAGATTDVPANLIPLLISIATWFFFEQQESMFDYTGADGFISVSDAWTYLSNADAPIFTITVPAGATNRYSAGMKIKLTQTTVKYFFILKVENTKLTVFGGTDYALTNAIISQISYSTAKNPKGFPMNPAKWTIETFNNTIHNQATPTSDVWYNIDGINIIVPLGLWKLNYKAAAESERTSGTVINVKVTLSDGATTESNPNLTKSDEYLGATGTIRAYVSAYAEEIIELAAQTTFYLNCKSFGAVPTANLWIRGDNEAVVIHAVCAYL